MRRLRYYSTRIVYYDWPIRLQLTIDQSPIQPGYTFRASAPGILSLSLMQMAMVA